MRTLFPVCCLLITFVVFTATSQQWIPTIPNRAVYSITANPQNTQTLYAGNLSRIIFKTTNGGRTWEERAIGDPGGASRIMLIKVHPTDTAIIFAAGIGLDGLQRSTDAGETWNTVLTSSDGSRFELGGQGALAIDPSNTSVLYAIRFNNGEVYKSTNRGETWDSLSVLNGVVGSDRFRAIIVHPDSSNVLLAGGRRFVPRRSTDGGQTWRNAALIEVGIHPDMDLGMYAFSATNSNTVYATIQRSLAQNSPSGGILKSDDGGQTWFRWRFQDTSLYAIDVRYTASGDEIYLGGNQIDFPPDPGFIRGDSIILWTPNGGQNWKLLDDIEFMENEIFDVGDNIWGFAVTEDSEGFPTVLVATEGGAYRSTAVTGIYEPPTLTNAGNGLQIDFDGSSIAVTSATKNESALVAVYDMDSKKLIELFVETGTTMSLQDLPTGAYIVTARTPNCFTSRLVIRP